MDRYYPGDAVDFSNPVKLAGYYEGCAGLEVRRPEVRIQVRIGTWNNGDQREIISPDGRRWVDRYENPRRDPFIHEIWSYAKAFCQIEARYGGVPYPGAPYYQSDFQSLFAGEVPVEVFEYLVAHCERED